MFILIVLGLVLSTTHIVGEQIHCWAPAQFPHEWIEYTKRVCWISNTYYIPMTEEIPNEDANKKHYVAYYQWVPFMILLQAVFFFVPSIVWKKLNTQSGIHVNKIVSMYGELVMCSDRASYKIVENLDRALRSQREYRTGCFARTRQTVAKNSFLICGKRYGNYLTTLYLLVKLLYIANSIGQLFLLNAFLGEDYYFYGIKVVNDMAHGNNWTTSRRFPRVTLCDFDIRSLGHKVHEFTVQCVLPINLLNEKVYLFIWFWLAFVSISTIMSFIAWLWTLFRRNRRDFIRKYLKSMGKDFTKGDRKLCNEFCEDYLRQDGIFVLRLIGLHTNDVVVGELIKTMWELYKKNNAEKCKPSEEYV